MRDRIVWLALSFAVFFTACSSNEQGGIRLHYAWTDEEGNAVTPPKMAQLYAWAELTYAGETKTAGPVWMGDDGNILRFENLPYGPKMKLTITMRLIDAAGGDEDLLEAPPAPKAGTDNIAYRCTSQEFSLVRGKVTDVENGCIMEPSAGIDPETGDPTIPELKVFDLDGTPLDPQVEGGREATRHETVNLCYKAPNATQVHIANLSDFTGMKSVTIPEATGGVCPEGYHAYEGWKYEEKNLTGEKSDRIPWAVYLKASDDLGAETKAASVQFFIDNKAPVIVNQVLSPTAANGTSTVVLALSFQEPVKGLTLDSGTLAFERIDDGNDPQFFQYHYLVSKHDDAEGTYSFSVTVIDQAGNEATLSLDGGLTIDRTLPDLTATIEKNDTAIEAGTTLYLKDGDELTVSLTLTETPKDKPRVNLGIHSLPCTQGADTEHYDCTLTIDKDSHEEGIADLTASFEDQAGNPYAAPLKAGIRLDYTPPSFTFTKNKSTTYNATEQITLTITANEELTAVTVNGAAQSTDTITWNITGVNTTDDHEVKAGGTDLAGNIADEVVIGSYTVDATYPTATISDPSPERIAGGATATITLSEITETLVVTLNGDTALCEKKGDNYECTYTATTDGGDEVKTLAITYTDEAGNTSSATKTVQIDRTRPALTLKKNKNTTYNKNDQILLSISSTEELSELTINGATQNDPAGVSWDITADTGDGTHDITATAKDKVGNPTVVTLTDSYTVDATYPTATISDPSPNRVKGNTKVTFTVTKIGTEELALIQVRNHDGSLSGCPGGTCTYTTATGTTGTDTTETITVQYADAAGNTLIEPAGTVYVDRTPPTFTLKKSKEGTYNAIDQKLLTVTANEEIDTLTINGIAQTSGGLTWDIIGTNTTGEHAVTVTNAIDIAGNITLETMAGTYTVDATYPTATISDPTPDRIAGGATATITLSEITETLVVTLNGDTALCEKNGDNYECAYTAPNDGGDEVKTLAIAYTDNAGNTSSATKTVEIDRTPPSLTIDLNDDAFNANETIRITVTASEELDDEPIVTIPAASMTLTDPTQISTFSWLYTVDPNLFDDGNYSVDAQGSDLVAYEGTDSADFSVDSSIPDLVANSYGIDRTKAGIGVVYTVDFETTEPVVGTDGVPTVKANGIVLTDCHQNGGDKIFQCTRTVGEEIDSTVYTITAYLADAAGNSRTVTIGSVMVDKTPPKLVTLPDTEDKTAVLSINAGDDCALTQKQVTTLASGSTAYLSVQVSEKLETGYTPVLTAKKEDIVRTFTLDSQNGLTYYFSYLYNEASPTEEMIGAYTLTLTLKDEAGNETTVAVSPDKPFQTAWNDPELVIDQTVVTYTRSPWGRGAPYEIKDNDGNLLHPIPANDYYEIGTNDLYAKTDRLPASAFKLDYDGIAGAPAQLRAWDRDGNYLALAKNKPNDDGSWPRTRIYSYDSSEVFISAIDSSCRETGTVKIQNVNWVASMNRKQASKPAANPHEYKTTRFFDARLGQAQRFLTEPEVYNPTDGLLTINTPTVFTATDYTWEVRGGYCDGGGAVYNDAREKVQSAPTVREWNGTSWTVLSTSPSVWKYSAFSYDIVRERVVQFGGGSDSLTWIGDMAFDDFYEMDVDGTWYSMAPATKPPARMCHGMAYDPVRNRTVLFGGAFATVNPSTHEFEGSVSYRDTWEWDGTNWTQRTGDTCTGDDCYICEASSCPPAIVLYPPMAGGVIGRHSMVYDVLHEKMLLFYESQTWEWNGTAWNKLNTSNSPWVGGFPTMAYDSLSGKVVLFGDQGYGFEQTWEWDGSDWTRMFPAVSARGGIDHPMYGRGSFLAYDPLHEESILIGSDTYTWRGTGHDIPGQIFTVAMDHSKISEYTGVTFRSVTANFDTGGIGDVAGEAVNGATLLFWNLDEWQSVATNESGIAEALPLQKNIPNDQTDIQTLLDANGNSISFAITPTAPRGFGTVTGEVVTDYAEIIVRYTINE